MRDIIDKLVNTTLGALAQVKDSEQIEKLRVQILGRKGELTGLLRSMGGLPPEERPTMGQVINGARERIEQALEEKAALIRRAERDRKLAAESIDVTIPGNKPPLGAAHPLTLTTQRLIDIFVSMGFSVEEGPEIEFDRYNFELLNLPKNHPSRDAQDTFYFSDNVVLRTHTSPVQARVMTTRQPPIRVICPGRTYRVDEVDATHSPVFSQCEGLVVGEGISMSDLKGTLDTFAREYYGEGISTRFRPSFFPFTEPSAEVDVTCAACRGKGCRVCKGTGWIEVLGAGMVNPKVFDLCGIDSKKYTGFAFGVGIERITSLRYNIVESRLLYENDVRFLRQFSRGGDL